MCFIDGNTIVPMVNSRDYKQALDGDEGKMTGGMGAHSPNHIYKGNCKAGRNRNSTAHISWHTKRIWITEELFMQEL